MYHGNVNYKKENLYNIDRCFLNTAQSFMQPNKIVQILFCYTINIEDLTVIQTLYLKIGYFHVMY